MKEKIFMLSRKIKVIVILASACFVLLGVLVYSSPPLQIDIQVSKEIQDQVNETRVVDLSLPLRVVSLLGNGRIAFLSVLGFVLLFWFTGNKKEALFLPFVWVSDLLILIIKHFFNRPRPSENYVDVLDSFNYPSFPSGHVTRFVVFFGFILAVILYRKKFSIFVRIVMAVCLSMLILTIPISRIYLGAHWVTDVIGGYLTGIIFLSIMLNFYFKSVNQDLRKIMEEN